MITYIGIPIKFDLTMNSRTQCQVQIVPATGLIKTLDIPSYPPYPASLMYFSDPLSIE